MRLEIRNERHPLAGLLDAIDGESHLCIASDRQQMQVHVGRASHRVGGGDGVLEALHVHDVPGPNVGFDQGVQSFGGRLHLSLHVVVNIARGVVVGWM